MRKQKPVIDDRILATIAILIVISSFIILPGCDGRGIGDGRAGALYTQEPQVWGYLYNADEGRFVENGEISVYPTANRVQTDREGFFEFSDFGRGQFQLIAKKDGYITSAWISTISTDYVSVNMVLGSTSPTPHNIFFKEGGEFKHKKLYDESSPWFYEKVFAKLPNFNDIQSLDWHPRQTAEFIFSGTMAGGMYKIYRYNTDTEDLFLLNGDDVANATYPSYSPDGSMFSFLYNQEIYFASTLVRSYIGAGGIQAQKLIRDQMLTWLDENNKTILRRHVLPTIPAYPHSGNPNGTPPESITWINALNNFWDATCNGYTLFPNLFTLNYGWIPVSGGTNPCKWFFNQGTVDPPNYNNTQLFDAENFPQECLVVFDQPVWAPNGNFITFLAKPDGCTPAQPQVCRRSCNNSDYEIFLAPADINRPLTVKYDQMFDKFSAIQVTNNNYEELNLSWDPGSHNILYDTKVPDTSGNDYYYLYISGAVQRGFQTRILLHQNPVPHHAKISADGQKILFMSKLIHADNPDRYLQVYAGDWIGGNIRNPLPVTSYTSNIALSFPSFYKIREPLFPY